MNRILVYLFFLLSFQLNAQYGGDYFVAVDGDDNNPGTFDQPWASWQKAFDEAQPGDTVYFRGGVYLSFDKVLLNPTIGHGVSGTADNPIVYSGYPEDVDAGNLPILDCKLHCDNMTNPYGPVYNSAINMHRVQYITLSCLHIRNVYQCDSVVDGGITATIVANITYDRIKLENIGQRGIYHVSGAWTSADSMYAVNYWGIAPQPIPFDHDTSRWINCDISDCCDTLSAQPGNAADAIKVISYHGSYQYFEGCRMWNYSDDAIDIGAKAIFKDCWVMSSSKYEDIGAWYTENNGFKCSSLETSRFPYYDSVGLTSLINQVVADSLYIYKNCLALFCPGMGFRLGGGDTTCNARFYNNTAWGNGIGIVLDTYNQDSIPEIFKNNIIYGSTQNTPIGTPYDISILNSVTNSTDYVCDSNSWSILYWGPQFQNNPSYNINNNDFVTTDSLALVNLFTAPRNPDGSLPDNKPMMLKSSSDLIDGGCNVGQSYCGDAPDLGFYEFELTSYFQLQDTAGVDDLVDIEYTGNASSTATYYWDFYGATIVSGSGQGPYSVQWSNAGCKTVSLYVGESGHWSGTTTHDITISQLTSNFIIEDDTCTGIPVKIAYTGNGSDTASYFWGFDGGVIIDSTGFPNDTFTVQWTSYGMKTVSLHVEESGFCSDTTTTDIFVSPLSSSFNVQETACIIEEVDIQYTGNASDTAIYNWDFDGANIVSGSGQGPYMVQWSNGGIKTVSLYIEESGYLSDTTTNEVFVADIPIFDIVSYPGDTVTINDTVVLTGNISAVSYLWSTGDTTQSIEVTNTLGSNGGVQTYWLTVTNEWGCSTTEYISVWFEMLVNIDDHRGNIDMLIYPNPVLDNLNIELEIVEYGEYIFEIIDNTGRVIISKMKTFEPGSQLMHFEMNSSNPGFYILTVRSDKGLMGLKKIVKYSNRG